jgi:hypothetical protein
MLIFQGDSCHGDTKSKQWVSVLLACSAGGSSELPPLVIGKCKSLHCFKNVKRLHAKYEANTNSWMTTKILEDYLTQLDRKLGAKNHKILLFIDHCVAYRNNTIFLRNIKVVFLPDNCISQLEPLDLGIIHAFKCHYRKELIQTVAMIEGGLLQDTTQMKLECCLQCTS